MPALATSAKAHRENDMVLSLQTKLFIYVYKQCRSAYYAEGYVGKNRSLALY